MRRMGIEALYRRPRTSIPARDAKVYPYMLDGLAIERPNQVWASPDFCVDALTEQIKTNQPGGARNSRRLRAIPAMSANAGVQSPGQERPDTCQRLVRGRQFARAGSKPTRRAPLNIDHGINSRVHGTDDIAQRVIQQHFVVSHMD